MEERILSGPVMEPEPSILVIEATQAPKNSKNKVNVSIVDKEQSEVCSFWLGFYSRGNLNPLRLLDAPSIEDLFYMAIDDGVKDDDPMMLSDASSPRPRNFYLVPGKKIGVGNKDHLCLEMIETVRAWNPVRLGIYFAPEVFLDKRAQDLIVNVLEMIVKKTRVRDLYLFPGRHGISSVLNTALSFKSAIEGQGLTVSVFH